MQNSVSEKSVHISSLLKGLWGCFTAIDQAKRSFITYLFFMVDFFLFLKDLGGLVIVSLLRNSSETSKGLSALFIKCTSLWFLYI